MTFIPTFNEDHLIDPAFERQIEKEKEMREAGIKRFRDNLQKAVEGHSVAGTKTWDRLVVNAHMTTVTANNSFISVAETRKAGRRHAALKFIKE